LPAFQVKVPHTLGKETAVTRLKDFAQHVAAQYKDSVSRLESNWNENRLTFNITAYGFNFHGTVTVNEDEAALDGTLPFAALPFRGRIESGFASELKKALA
jgi:hypothetical protein